MNTKIKNLLKSVAAVAVVGGIAPFAQAATISVTTNITTNETWTSNNEYILTEIIYVESPATLTIEAGTVIRGEGESSPGAFDPGTLVIARGADIQANGTASDPIIFTNLADDNVPGSTPTAPYDAFNEIEGTWGGLIILGETFLARGGAGAPSAANENQIEGLIATPGGLGSYGGGDDDDDSGSVTFVQLRYGGFNLSANNEINGFTLGCVGRETEIEYVEVYQNRDDAFEWFGGTVNTKYLVGFNCDDEIFDIDEGYRGKGQFWFGVQGYSDTFTSDLGSEIDGATSGDDSEPYALFTTYNATYIGNGVGTLSGNGVDTDNTALNFRDNAGGRFYRSAFVDFDGAAALIEGDTTAATTSGNTTSARRSEVAYSSFSPNAGAAFYPGPDSDFQLEVRDSVFTGFVTLIFDSAAGNTTVSPFPGEFGSVSNSLGSYDPGFFTAGVGAKDYNNSASTTFTNPFVTYTRGVPAGFLELNRNASIVTSIDPRPAVGSTLLTHPINGTVTADGFFDDVDYIGAFSPDNNWAEGWTLSDTLGHYANTGTNVAGPASAVATPSQITVSFPTTSGVNYSVRAADTPAGPFTRVVGNVVGTGGTDSVVDTTALTTKQFYEVVAL